MEEELEGMAVGVTLLILSVVFLNAIRVSVM
jgi:hypothetical protein